MMEFHPSQIPAIKTFEIDNEKSATIAADQMVNLGFEGIKGGYLVLMPKEKRTAKRIGYTITTAVNYGLRRTDADISEYTFSLFCAGGFDASYPSGHSARAAAVGTILAIALATKFPRGAPLLLIYPAMMAFSRIYVLQHYPSDVIGGALLGVLLAGIVAKKTHLDDSKS